VWLFSRTNASRCYKSNTADKPTASFSGSFSSEPHGNTDVYDTTNDATADEAAITGRYWYCSDATDVSSGVEGNGKSAGKHSTDYNTLITQSGIYTFVLY